MDEQLTDGITRENIISNLDKSFEGRSNLSEREKNIQQNVKTLQGKRPSDVVNGSRAGEDRPNIPTTANTNKTDRANAIITTTPERDTEGVDSNQFFNDLFEQSGIEPEMAGKFTQALNEASGGKFMSAGEQVLTNLLGARVDQAERKKDTERLQEQAGLPELEAEKAQIDSNYDLAEMARNSRLVNEVGGQTTISKRTAANRQNEIQRQYGLQVADNRINELAINGEINAATQLIDSKMELKYGDLEAEIELYNSQLEAIAPFMDAEATQLAEQRKFVLDQATNMISSQREQDRELELSKAQAIKNASDRGASAQQIAQIQDSNSVSELAATGFMTSSKELVEIENIRSQIQERRDNALVKLLEEQQEEEKTTTDKTEAALGSLSLINELKTATGMSSAIGFGAKKSPITRTAAGAAAGGATGALAGSFIPIFGNVAGGVVGTIAGGLGGFFAGDEAVPGSARADFETKANRLADTFLVQNLSKMTGVLTDKDLEVLRNEGTTIGNFDQSEESWLAELDRLERMMRRGIQENGLTDEQAQFWFGFTPEDINAVDQALGTTSQTSTQETFNAANYY